MTILNTLQTVQRHYREDTYYIKDIKALFENEFMSAVGIVVLEDYGASTIRIDKGELKTKP